MQVMPFKSIAVAARHYCGIAEKHQIMTHVIEKGNASFTDIFLTLSAWFLQTLKSA